MTQPKPILFGYARVSTDDQSLQLQLDALAQAGVSPNRIYTDKASGARGTHRPGLAAVLKAVRKDDSIIAWKLDRLGRNLEELIDTVRRIEAKGANLRVITMHIDTATPGGRFIFHIFGALAEFERELIVERTNAGLASARAQGRVGGRKPVPPEVEAEAIKLLRAGVLPREVAKRLKIGKTTIYNKMNGDWASALAEGTAK
jgi:DNA invertase Pin-like site-specific DNA recombinase